MPLEELGIDRPSSDTNLLMQQTKFVIPLKAETNLNKQELRTRRHNETFQNKKENLKTQNRVNMVRYQGTYIHDQEQQS